MKTIKDLKNLKGKKVLLRVDFNVPIKDAKVEDDFRINKALPTIQFLQKRGAKIILICHLGKGGESLLPVADSLNKLIKITFIDDLIYDKAEKSVFEMKNGEVILLQNLRNYAGEKNCDKNFAKKLASLADVYINDAFSVSHRKDASIVLLPKLLPAYAGFQLVEEIKNLSNIFKKPKHPFLFILGGAKFSTKMPLIKKYLKIADYIFIGGALLNDFLKYSGYEVGNSLVDDTKYGIEKIINNKKFIIPEFVFVKNTYGEYIEKNIKEILKSDVILDVGQKSIKLLFPIIEKSKMILWNGPLGKYEVGAGGSTKKTLKYIFEQKNKTIVLGGGDLVSCVPQNVPETRDLLSNLFISTGGGATLDFLANGTLPGIKALQ
ncbi:MAG: phosphoglycerate kinase [Candidatus Paceibacterota bacterium]